MKHLIWVIVFAFLFTSPYYAILPQSKEASILQQSSPSLWQLEARGIYYSQESKKRKRRKDVKKHGVEKAIEDAKKAAVYALLYSGDQALLADSAAYQRFSEIQDLVFSDDIVNQIVVSVADELNYSILLDDKQGIKVGLNIEVNPAYLKQFLEDRLVIYEEQAIDFDSDYPFIVLQPQLNEGVDTPDHLQYVSAFVESHLSDAQFDVLIPEQSDSVQNVLKAFKSRQSSSSKSLLALSLGSDLYIELNLSIDESDVQERYVRVSLALHESSSGRLIDTQTAVALISDTTIQEAFQEASLKALELIQTPLTRYWSTELARGSQYTLLIELDSANWSEDKKKQVLEDAFHVIHSASLLLKENALSDRYLDLSIWVSDELFSSSKELFNAMSQQFSSYQYVIELHSLYQNQKLLLLKLQ